MFCDGEYLKLTFSTAVFVAWYIRCKINSRNGFSWLSFRLCSSRSGEKFVEGGSVVLGIAGGVKSYPRGWRLEGFGMLNLWRGRGGSVVLSFRQNATTVL